MVFGCENTFSGFQKSPYSMVYSSHLSWRTPNSPILITSSLAIAFPKII